MTIVPGKTESEFEDLFDPAIYRQSLLEKFGVDLAVSVPRNRNAKWSARLADAFSQAGVPFDDLTKMRAKLTVAQVVADAPGAAILPPFEGIITALVNRLETKLAAVS